MSLDDSNKSKESALAEQLYATGIFKWFSESHEEEKGTESCIVSLTGLGTDPGKKDDLLSAIKGLFKELTWEEESQLEARFKSDSQPSEGTDSALHTSELTFEAKSWLKRRSAADLIHRALRAHDDSQDTSVDVERQSDHFEPDPVEIVTSEEFYRDFIRREEAFLEVLFRKNPSPTRKQIHRLGVVVCASPWFVDQWFYQRRVKKRLQETGEALDQKDASRAFDFKLRSNFRPLPQSERNFTWAELDFLEVYLDIKPKPTRFEMAQIAQLLGATVENVKEWFIEHGSVMRTKTSSKRNARKFLESDTLKKLRIG